MLALVFIIVRLGHRFLAGVAEVADALDVARIARDRGEGDVAFGVLLAPRRGRNSSASDLAAVSVPPFLRWYVFKRTCTPPQVDTCPVSAAESA